MTFRNAANILLTFRPKQKHEKELQIFTNTNKLKNCKQSFVYFSASMN